MKDESKPARSHRFIPHPSSLLIELGTEELPADNVPACEKQLRESLIAALDEARIDHGEVTTYCHAAPHSGPRARRRAGAAPAGRVGARAGRQSRLRQGRQAHPGCDRLRQPLRP